MKPEHLTELSDQELLQKMKKLKTNKIIDAVLIGATIGITVYGVVNKGFGISVFFPLIVGYVIMRNSKNNELLYQEVQKELETRNSKQ
ncbi:hypothetical protein JI750_12650 [Flavobacterium sp. GN10]|uniref:FUSC family protein n=1 Tax=Flavobacterium tagetis TaxID=2801336 RepID=A0ABS1KEX9_9FLAO|nr:hypothetical protein [Flavobacterium tagetis]MBL0737747.1 hypothetical protein [Flavobacterium tagetis]